MVLIFEDGVEAQSMPEEKFQEYMQSWVEWDKALQSKLSVIAGEALMPEATVISGRDTKVNEGLFVGENRQFAVGGFYLVEATSKEEVVEAMKSCPTFKYDGNIEVREVMDM